MKLYHGSNMRIEQVDLSFSKPNKDFGRAFCTQLAISKLVKV